jgi:hypothetical protein
MKKTLALMAGALLLVGMFAGCEATDDNGTDTFQPPCGGLSNVQEACLAYRDGLCERYVACETFGSLNECEIWFASDEGYGGCPDTTTCLTTIEQTNLSTCVANLPTANCEALSDPGPEATIPACGEF